MMSSFRWSYFYCNRSPQDGIAPLPLLDVSGRISIRTDACRRSRCALSPTKMSGSAIRHSILYRRDVYFLRLSHQPGCRDAQGVARHHLHGRHPLRSRPTAIENFQKDIRTSRKAIIFSEADAEKTIKKRLRTVADLVFAPLEGAIAGKQRLLISADDALWLVPWAAIPLKTGDYAIERHDISFLVSGRELVTNKALNLAKEKIPRQLRTQWVFNGTGMYLKLNRKPTTLGLMIAAPAFNLDLDKGPLLESGPPTDPQSRLFLLSRASTKADSFGNWDALLGSANEATATAPLLEKYLSVKPAVYTDGKAVKSKVLTAVAPRVIVISTHGYFLPKETIDGSALSVDTVNPLLRCGLVFAGANVRGASSSGAAGGILTGLEIVDLDLSGTELVVLSACDSGVGSLRSGDGVIGLRHAFRLAGAEAVVATLWQIPDRESSELMVDFWKQLGAGDDAATALRYAQLKMIKDRRSSERKAAHPYFWAAFTLTGQTTFQKKVVVPAPDAKKE
jgi:CHAT domain-containing protein